MADQPNTTVLSKREFDQLYPSWPALNRLLKQWSRQNRRARRARYPIISRAVVEAFCVTLLSSVVTVFGLWLAFGRVCR